MQILSPEQIQEIKLSDYPITGKHSLAYALLKSQLKQDEAELKKVFEKIEDKIWKSAYITPTNKPIVINSIQQLKKEMGI